MILAEKPWTRIRDALHAGGKVIAILPCGASEAHGPHLPLATDNIIAEGIARRVAEGLEQAGITAFVLPTLAYAPADFAVNFAGTIGITAGSASAVIADIAGSLEQQGFACLAIANAHFDPANVEMLRSVTSGRAGRMPIVYPDFTRRNLAACLTDEFQSGACHAGRFETSLVLADRPDLVDRSIALGLAGNPSSLTAAFTRGAKNFEESGGPEAYFGKPGEATALEGEESYSIMAEIMIKQLLSQINFF